MYSTLAVEKKQAWKKFLALTGTQTHVLVCDTGAALLPTELSSQLGAGHLWVCNIPMGGEDIRWIYEIIHMFSCRISIFSKWKTIAVMYSTYSQKHYSIATQISFWHLFDNSLLFQWLLVWNKPIRFSEHARTCDGKRCLLPLIREWNWIIYKTNKKNLSRRCNLSRVAMLEHVWL